MKFEGIKKEISEKVLLNTHYSIMESFNLIDEIMIEVKEEEEKGTLDESLEKLINSRARAKNRWVSKEKEEGGFLHKEIEEGLKLFTSENGIKKFEERYGEKDYAAWKKKKEKGLGEWAKDNSKGYMDFPYFQYFQRWRQETGIKNDIRIMLMRHLIQMEEDNEDEPVVAVLNDWDFPIDYTARATFPMPDSSAKSVSITLNASADSSVEAQLDLEAITSEFYNSPLLHKLMNDWDMDLMRFVLYKVAKQQYSDQFIVFTIREILEFMNAPSNGRNYEIIEASIKKMVGLTVYINTPNKRFTLRFLEKYIIEERPGLPSLITVILTHDVYNQALNGKITNMYKEVIDDLGPAARALIYKLQKVRIQRHSKKESRTMVVDLDFFTRVLLSTQQRKSRFKNVIDTTLREIINRNVTLESFERLKADQYRLIFKEFTKKELKDLAVEEGPPMFAAEHTITGHAFDGDIVDVNKM